MNAAATLGPTARRVLAMSIDGRKRKAVLLAIAIYTDAGRNDPSIRELAARAKLSRGVVVSVIDRLQADGLLAVRRGDNKAGERNRYALTEGRP